MNKFSYLYLSVLFMLLFGACQKTKLEEISNPNKSVLAYRMKALDKPFSKNNSFILFRDDYSIIRIEETGNYSTIANLSTYFPALSDLNTKYNYIHFRQSPDKVDFWLNAVVENISNDGYYNAKWMQIDTFGNVKANINITIPPIDSTFSRDYKDYTKINNEIFWIFDTPKKGEPRMVYLEFLRYNPITDNIKDSILLLSDKAKYLSLLSNKNQLYIFYSTSGMQQAPKLNLKIFDSNLKETRQLEYPIVTDNIYFSKKMKNNDHFFIAGSYSGLSSDNQVNENFVAEIDLKGNVYWQKNKFEQNYFYFTDIYQLNDSFITSGYFKASFGFFPFTSFSSQVNSRSSFFMGSINPPKDTALYAANSEFGLSSTLASAKTSYGFAFLVYMSQRDKTGTEEYIWLYKFDNKMKRKIF